jgi:predicted Zn-dependent peptidase
MKNYSVSTLSNKLPLLLAPLSGTATVTVLVMVKTGSKYESRAQSGLSHFLEHAFFKGTKKRPTALRLATDLDSLGGDYNAFTTKEYTGYYIKTSAGQLTKSLDLISDILLNSNFGSEEIEREKGVIVEEINMYEDNPLMKIDDLFETCLYGDTPAGLSVAGSAANVLGFKRQDFVDYFKSQYGSCSLTLIIAGRLPKNVKALAERYFGATPANQWRDKVKTIERQTKPAAKFTDKKTDQTVLLLGVRTVPANHRDEPVLRLIGLILGGSMSSRLFSEVRERRSLAYSIHTINEFYTDTGYLATKAGIKAGQEAAAVKIILHEYKKLADETLPATELARAKEMLRGQLAIQLETSDDLASWYGQQAILRRDYLTPQESLAMLEKVSAADIKRVAKKVFINAGLNLALIGNLSAPQKKSLVKTLHFDA